MRRKINHLYEFGPFRLDSAEHLLLREGKPVLLRPKVFDMLMVLVENRGHLVEKEKLMNAVWPDTFVEEANLNKNISMLRQALGENQTSHQYIETVPKLGYRFIADVKELADGSTEIVVERHTTARMVDEEEEETSSWIEPEPQTQTDVSTSKTDAVLSAVKSHPRGVVLSLAIVLFAIAAIVGGMKKFVWNQPAASRAAVFEAVKLTRLTTNGQATVAAISLDGKYVAHVMNEKGQQSLWLRQVAEAHDVQIVPAAEVQYWSVIFSPDNNHVYYIAWEKNKTDAALYRIPVLGGLAKKLLVGIGSSVTFSPDGKRIAYVKDYSAGKSSLMLAEADGTEEKVLLTRKHPDAFSYYPASGPAWSPDGKIIISAVGRNGSFNNLLALRMEDGSETVLKSEMGSSGIRQIAWLPDSSGLIMVARADKSLPKQIWHLSYPGGEARKITNDLNDYDGISLNRDSDMMVTVQTAQVSQLWVATDGDSSHAKQLTSEVGSNLVRENFSWTPEGKLVYCSNAGGRIDLWIMDADGGNRRQLTSDAGNNIHPTISPDGRDIIFASDRTGIYHIWRMNIDSGSAKQLTDGNQTGDAFPHCSPDGRWVVYQQGYGWVKGTLWKVPIDGGVPLQLTDTVSLRPAISPNGKWIAHYYRDDEVWGLAVISSDGGSVTKKFVLPPTVESRIVRWSPDGMALLYLDSRDGASNIWTQPLDGGPARRLTDFKSNPISYFDWTRDGRRLAFTHTISISDVVLLSNYQ